MVYNIWMTVLVLGVTGYMMGTIQFFGVEWVEDVHMRSPSTGLWSQSCCMSAVLF